VCVGVCACLRGLCVGVEKEMERDREGTSVCVCERERRDQQGEQCFVNNITTVLKRYTYTNRNQCKEN